MTFINYILLPKLFREYRSRTESQRYEPAGLEKWGDQIITTFALPILNLMMRKVYFTLIEVYQLLIK
ncbi:hypothetical protein DMENIID0001_042180 [Sergentomyia squamirostris]